jgi:hypothetical protein
MTSKKQVAAKFVQDHAPGLSVMLTAQAHDVHPIFADMAGKLVRYGSLSDKQVEFALKLLKEHCERHANGGKTDREVAWQREKDMAEDCPTGRVQVIGTVLKTELKENQFGTTLKMALKSDKGFVVWVTVPDNLAIFDVGEYQRGLAKGDRVALTATLTPSTNDPKFGFGKRPTGGKLLTEAPVAA